MTVYHHPFCKDVPRETIRQSVRLSFPWFGTTTGCSLCVAHCFRYCIHTLCRDYFKKESPISVHAREKRFCTHHLTFPRPGGETSNKSRRYGFLPPPPLSLFLARAEHATTPDFPKKRDRRRKIESLLFSSSPFQTVTV